MKLSFSISESTSKSKTKPKPKLSSGIDAVNQTDNGTAKQFVTEFDPSKTPTNSTHKLVIPPKDNEWRPHKRMKNLDLLPSLQSDSGGLQFEIFTEGHDGDDKSISYGLNIRHQSAEEEGVVKVQEKHENTENMLLEKLKYDLQRLPEDRGFDEFKDMPVEGFGAALLAGYGWQEGRGIGRNAKEDVKVKQYRKRTDKEGLGFVAPASNTKDRDGRKEKKRDDGYDNVNGDVDGHGDGFFVGKDIRVVAGGRDILGLKGRILRRVGADWVVLKLAETKEELKLSISDIADLGSKEEEKCLRKLKALQIETKQPKDRDNRKRTNESSKENRESVTRDRGQAKDDRKRWLRNHIRVRIISKDLKGGRFYLKKGEVVDVVGPYMCDISMDETKELVQGVDQDLLETALPRRGCPVLVLYGKHKGVYGNLIKRDLDEETGVVQDSDTHELLDVKLEQIAEYVGDPSYIGY